MANEWDGFGLSYFLTGRSDAENDPTLSYDERVNVGFFELTVIQQFADWNEWETESGSFSENELRAFWQQAKRRLGKKADLSKVPAFLVFDRGLSGDELRKRLMELHKERIEAFGRDNH